MMFEPTHIAGAYIIELDKRTDGRGFFACSSLSHEFSDVSFNHVVQMNSFLNVYKHTLRSVDYQVAFYQGDTLLRCVRGAVYDVLIDLGPHSPTLMRHLGTCGPFRASMSQLIPGARTSLSLRRAQFEH